MLTIKFGKDEYTFDLQEALAGLTGTDSMMVEDFLGGWSKFRDPGNLTRSTIVMVWLAKRSAGETPTFEEIAATPGLVFGDMVEVTGDTDDPEDPAVDPGRPLAAPNDSTASTGGEEDAGTTPATSGSSGQHLSSVSTG